MELEPDSRTARGLSAFFGFVGLNLVHLLVCAPIITIGAATSALFGVTLRYSEEEGGELVGPYLRSLRSTLLPGTVVLLVFLLPAAAVAFAGLFWLFQGGPLAIVGPTVAAIAVLYLFAAFLYGTAMVGRYDQPLSRTLKNAVLLPLAESWRTGVLVLVPITAVSLAAAFPPFLVVIAAIGFSVGAYGAGFLLRGAFARH